MENRRTLVCALLLGCGLALLSVAAAPLPARAQGTGLGPELCYAVADGYIDEQNMEVNGRDTLAYLNRETGDTQPINGLIPNINASLIEAITFVPGGQQLYAANGGQLGTLSLTSATFTPVGNVGVGQGQLDADPELESLELNDLDGISISPITGEMWGTHHTAPLNAGDPNPPDVLVRINRDTGLFVPGAFADPVNPGQQVDFVVIQPIEGLNDIGDIAIDPLDGKIYAIMSEGGTRTRLVTINPADGTTTDIGPVVRQAAPGEPSIQDIEGLGFDNAGVLYGSTGNEGPDRNLLWAINKATAVATLIGQFNERLIDIEALDCLTQPGFVAIDGTINGQDADHPADAVIVSPGATVETSYLVRNTGALVLTNVTVTDDNATPGNTADDRIICQGFSLEPGRSNQDIGVACESDSTAQAGQHVFIATVTAVDGFGNQYTAQEQNHYAAFAGTTVGDRVWHDVNQNGIQDAAEINSGIDGVVVSLFTEAGAPVTSTTTAGGGFYSFSDLAPGRYYLEFSLPAGYQFTAADQGSDDSLDSDVEPSTGRTAVFELAAAEINRTLDAGLTGAGATASIQGVAWEDLNGDGIQNDGDLVNVGRAGVIITLHARNMQGDFVPISMTTTTANGAYSFTGLTLGDYQIEATRPDDYAAFTLSNQGTDNLLDSDVDPQSNKTTIFTLEAGEVEQGWDIGLVKAVTIGGEIWDDVNADGRRNDSGAAANSFDGIVVTLLNNAGQVVTTTTVSGGAYSLTTDSAGQPLLPGSYRLQLSNLPDGLTLTQANVGTDDLDSDFEANGRTELFTITSGSTGRWDAGLVPGQFQSERVFLPGILK